MEPILLPVMVLSLVFVVIQTFVVLFLAKRAIKLKLGYIWFMAASGAAFIISGLLGATSSPLQILIQPFNPLFVIAFTKRTFYDQTRSRYAFVETIAIILTSFVYVVRLHRLFYGDSEVLYLVNQAVLFPIFFVAYAWLAKACFNANRRFSKDAGVEAWIQKRYSLLGTSAVSTMFLTTPSFFMNSTSEFYTMVGFLCLLIIVTNSLVFSILNYLSWVMPPWFKRHLGAPLVDEKPGMRDAGERPGSLVLADKEFNTRETINIIDYLGNLLASRINKSPAAAKGLLLVIFQAEQDEKGVKTLRFSDVMRVISNKLTSRLDQLGIKGSDRITKQFCEEITANQSALLMMSV